jgi:arylsulfatase A-like enzyme
MAKILQIILSIQLLLSSIIIAFCEEGTKPNVILIITDEHNLRTIGKYRELLTAATGSTDQAFVWGEDAKVDTKYIDSLADTGATFSNFHTVSPLCTTSRGALMTGTYPSTNGAIGNHVPMNADAKTFANVLQTDLGYSTAYMGKVC